MSNRQLNLTYFSPKVEKRKSSIEGRGLFAKQQIKAGEVVVVKGGYILTRSQRDQIGKELGPSEIQITEDLFIGPANKRQREGGMMHLNHSCEPNLGLQGQIVYVALRDIAVDEELTFDYAMTDDEPGEMQCRCGTPSCRGTITGLDWRKPEIQRRYDGYFSWFIQRRIDAVRKASGSAGRS
jgi:SET domain-containing protein